MTICPRCGTDNRDGARFCDACGTTLLASAAEVDSAAITADLPGETLAFEGAPASAHDAEPRSTAPADTFYIGMLDPELADIPDATPQPEASSSPSMTQEMPRIGDVADTQNKAYIAPKPGKKLKMPSHIPNKGILAAIIIVAILLIGAGTAFATYSLQLWGGKQVPNVIGLTAEDATDKLEAAGFSVSQVLVKSDDVEGIVLKSTPAPDQRAEAGSEVTIDVSCARTVPEVIGLTQEEALALLQEEGFENVEVTEQKSNEAAGTIIAVSPEVGVRSKAQAKITLTAAVPFVVPATAGLSLDEATAALEAEGYVVTTAYVYTEEADEGTILGTDPAEGTQLASGSEVCINIAKSRAAEVVGYAKTWFAASSDYSLNGMSYELKSVEAVDYQGDDTCSFTIIMRPYETHSWFGSEPETRYGNEQRINGTMRFSSDGTLESIDPALKRN